MKRHAWIAFLALAAAAHAQKIETGIGERWPVAALPAPEWRPATGGAAAAELRIVSGGASALRLQFGRLSLADGETMYLYGRNADGRVAAVHGPYTGTGPLNVPGFDSQPLPGSEIVISVRSRPGGDWPFTLLAVEQFGAGEAARLELQPVYTPTERRTRRPAGGRNAHIAGSLARYRVENGIAVMEDDLVLAGGSFAHAAEPATRWPGGVIPYIVAYGADLLPGDSLDRKISAAIDHWNARFPGLLVPWSNQADFVTLRNFSGTCRSHIGRTGGQQYLDIDANCPLGAIVHEIGHTLGLLHEFSGPGEFFSPTEEASLRARYCAPAHFTAPASITVDSTGAAAQFSVTIPPYCHWSLSTPASWISLQSATAGSGSTHVRFSAAPNPDGPARAASVQIGGLEVRILQGKSAE